MLHISGLLLDFLSQLRFCPSPKIIILNCLRKSYFFQTCHIIKKQCSCLFLVSLSFYILKRNISERRWWFSLIEVHTAFWKAFLCKVVWVRQLKQPVKLIPSVLIINLKTPSFNLWFSPILLDLSGFCFVFFFMQVLLINHHECGSEEEFITSLFLSMFNFRYTQRSLSFPIRFLEGSYIFIVSFLWLW